MEVFSHLATLQQLSCFSVEVCLGFSAEQSFIKRPACKFSPSSSEVLYLVHASVCVDLS